VLMVAGGIGVTPFVSQLCAIDQHDTVLVYGVSSAAEIAFTEELAHVRVVLVCPEQPQNLPEAWTWVQGRELTRDVIVAAVPDLADRVALISGPPAMVNAVRSALSGACKAMRTDYFTGY
jgi:NAD(P)H-flavin reductase